MTAVTSEDHQRRYRFGFWSWLVFLSLVRLLLAGSIGLGIDESHYVLYARRLAWGYLDHPPLVAWMTALGTLPGENLLFYRLLPILCNFFSFVLLRKLALQLWRNEAVAFWALIVFTLLPYQHLLLVALLPDAGLNLFWCATLVAFWQAHTRGRWRAWIATGLLLGGALLAKYHAILLPLCFAGYLLTSPDHRPWFKHPHPYIALLIAMVVYSPNFLWNAHHGWISYRFHLLRAGSKGFELGQALVAIGGQLAAWSPVVFAMLVAAWWIILRRKPKNAGELFALWTSLPVFAFFIGSGFFGKMLPHWTSPGWWSGSLALVTVALHRIVPGGTRASRWQFTVVTGAIISVVMSAGIYATLYRPLVKPVYNQLKSASIAVSKRFAAVPPLPEYRAKFDPTNELFGWQEAAADVYRALQRMPRPRKTFVFCHRYFTASQLAVYLPPNTVVTTLGRKVDQYRLWFKPADYQGWDAIFVDLDRRPRGPGRYLALFERVDGKPQKSHMMRAGDPILELRLYRYYGYKGGYEN